MRRLVFAIVLVLGAMAFSATPAMAADVCPGTQHIVDTDTNTFDSTGTNTVTTTEGIVVTLSADGLSATFDLPAGMASAVVCVKAGSEASGGGTKEVTVTDGQSVSGLGSHEISHLSIVSVTATTPPGPQPPGPQPPGPQPPGPQPPGPQPPGPQPPTPQPPGGGAGGTPPSPLAPPAPPAAGTGGGGALPFTGLPVWIPMLMGAGLLGTGLVLLRRRRDAES